MDYLLLFFVMTNGTGYIPPMEVRPADITCGLVGAVVGVAVDRLVNPQLAIVPDPIMAGAHCHIDIAVRVAALPHGEYHLAATEIAKLRKFGAGEPVPERYTGVDPHTSSPWLRSLAAPGLPPRPTNFRISRSQ